MVRTIDKANLTPDENARFLGDVSGVVGNVTLAALLVSLQLDAGGSTVVFNSDGSIVETLESGVVVTTTFGSNGSIASAYGAPFGRTLTTTFNADGSITTGAA